ncbi:5-methyltetrahydropteroyltriglutamate--homocysteine S-methyltransferase [Clostridium sp. 19966]|uniref:5-methyltetrahydropteroyltriglutamate-- homocysteine S-methyltransferase n=1 Tax=Clostridium sp. 19966 TaxID=2768166 RepID=UPI0028E0869D|nr:5-methyltetrahydropteroyltriglutamate--homocysteine S-methyltransferase [Clostridium sp. 19966]MDT8716814.1 5-methyltetrahydropteroyltriglutamate--homocysteine S-methyltransferase [Clostridium sp. 19966]
MEKKIKKLPFHYDIVGSFLRTEEIKAARFEYENKNITASRLRQIEDIEIMKLVEKQKQIGLKAVTDGEFRRSWWHLDFFKGIKGVEKISLNQGINFKSPKTKAETVRIKDKIYYEIHPMLEDFKYLKSIAGECIPKFTIPAPSLFHFVISNNENKAYRDNEELFSDIVKVYSEALKDFYAAGCRYIQLDDTTWGTLCSERHRQHFKSKGIDPDTLAKEYSSLINESIKECPEDMLIAMHVCRGNLRSAWFASGGYEPVAKELFGKVNVDGFFLEYDDERSGDFAPLRFIKNQFVALGLITTKHGGLESKEHIKAKISEAARYVDIKNLCLSPQCGFASTEEGNLITEEEQWDKVKLVIDTANEVWNDLL